MSLRAPPVIERGWVFLGAKLPCSQRLVGAQSAFLWPACQLVRLDPLGEKSPTLSLFFLKMAEYVHILLKSYLEFYNFK